MVEVEDDAAADEDSAATAGVLDSARSDWRRVFTVGNCQLSYLHAKASLRTPGECWAGRHGGLEVVLKGWLIDQVEYKPTFRVLQRALSEGRQACQGAFWVNI